MKIKPLLLTALLAVSLSLGGCGNNDTDPSSKKETAASAADVRDILSPRERMGEGPSDSPDWVKIDALGAKF